MVATSDRPVPPPREGFPDGVGSSRSVGPTAPEAKSGRVSEDHPTTPRARQPGEGPGAARAAAFLWRSYSVSFAALATAATRAFVAERIPAWSLAATSLVTRASAPLISSSAFGD